MGKDLAPPPYKIVAGVDCAYSKDGKIQVCVAVLINSENFKVIENSCTFSNDPSPYIPGKFYLREGRISIETLKKLKNSFDLLLVNGHGKANVEGRGLACFIGEAIKVPTLGVARELIYGNFKVLHQKKGEISPVEYKNNVIGYAVCTKDNTKPLFISEGYLLEFLKIKDFFLSLCLYKNPEPLRKAHIFAKNILNNLLLERKGGSCD